MSSRMAIDPCEVHSACELEGVGEIFARKKCSLCPDSCSTAREVCTLWNSTARKCMPLCTFMVWHTSVHVWLADWTCFQFTPVLFPWLISIPTNNSFHCRFSISHWNCQLLFNKDLLMLLLSLIICTCFSCGLSQQCSCLSGWRKDCVLSCWPSFLFFSRTMASQESSGEVSYSDPWCVLIVMMCVEVSCSDPWCVLIVMMCVEVSYSDP